MTRTPSPPEGNWFTRALTQPRDELDRWERALRFPYDLGRYGARQLRQDRAPQMAGALAFRTLFALLPVLVVGTMLLRAIGAFDWFRLRLGEFFSELNLDKFQVVPPEANEPSVTLSDWLLDLIGQVQNINLAAITWVGVVVLFYSAMGLMVTIENSFNNIYRAPEGRAWLRRLPIYWTVLTVAPAAIAMTMYMSSRFDALVAEQGGWLSVFRAAPVIWSVTATWIVTFALYKLIPNTNVSYRPALVGALVASILLEVGKRTLGAYFQNAMSFSLLYGSLGLIPVFMFWVYLMWLVILFGLEVSATLQMLGGRRLEEIEASKAGSGLVDPASVLLVMEVVVENFQSAQPTTARQVADATSMPEATVLRMFEGMIEDGILHRLNREDVAVSLARPPQQISADELIDVAFRMVDQGSAARRSALLERLRDAQRNLASQVTLATLASPRPVVAGGEQTGE